jgi:hypothetical protein
MSLTAFASTFIVWLTLPAIPKPPAHVDSVADAAAFIDRIAALHGPEAPAVRFARHVTSRMTGTPTLAFIVAPWGTTGCVASMSDDVMALVLPNGQLRCYADTGPCPDAADLGVLPVGFDYEPTIEMGTPAGLGFNGHIVVPLDTPAAVGIIRGFPQGDGAPERYDVVRFDAAGFGRVLVQNVAAFRDIDGDGRLDAEIRAGWDDVVWTTPVYGHQRGGLVPDHNRVGAYHAALLAEAIARLESAMPPEDPTSRSCGDLFAPAFVAFAHAHLGLLPVTDVRKAVKAWGQRMQTTEGPVWGERCPSADKVLTCLAKLPVTSRSAFGRCLSISPD